MLRQQFPRRKRTNEQKIVPYVPFVPLDNDGFVTVDDFNQPEQTVQEQPAEIQTKITVKQAEIGGKQFVKKGMEEIRALEKAAITSQNQNYGDASVVLKQFTVNLFSGAPKNNAQTLPKLCESLSDPALRFGVHLYQNGSEVLIVPVIAVVCAASFVEILSRREAAGPGAALNLRQALSDTLIGCGPMVGYRLVELVVDSKNLPTIQVVNNEIVNAFVNGVGENVAPLTTVVGSRNFLKSMASFFGKFASMFTSPKIAVTIINNSFTRVLADIFNAMVSVVVTPTIDGLSRLMGPAPAIQNTTQKVGKGIVKSVATKMVANEIVGSGMTVFIAEGSTAAISTVLRKVATPQVLVPLAIASYAVHVIEDPARAANEVATVANNTATFFTNHPYMAAGLVTLGVGVAAVAYGSSKSK